MLDADGRLVRLLVGRLIQHLRRIEHHQVRIGRQAHTALVLHPGHTLLQPARGQERQLLHRLHQRERTHLANIPAQHARTGAGMPRMAGQTVAGNHRQRMGQRVPHHGLGIGVDNDHATRLPKLRKALGREPLAGRGPLQIAVINARPPLPAGIKDRGPNVRHARRVRIALHAQVQPARPRRAEEFQHPRGGLVRGALHMADMRGRARYGRGGDQFLHGGEDILRPGFALGPDVQMAGRMEFRRRAKHLKNLPLRRARRVLDAKPHRDRTACQATLDVATQLRNLCIRGRVGGGH